jgi:hypothetical protein
MHDELFASGAGRLLFRKCPCAMGRAARMGKKCMIKTFLAVRHWAVVAGLRQIEHIFLHPFWP